jgi:hypothetical protein
VLLVARIYTVIRYVGKNIYTSISSFSFTIDLSLFICLFYIWQKFDPKTGTAIARGAFGFGEAIDKNLKCDAKHYLCCYENMCNNQSAGYCAKPQYQPPQPQHHNWSKQISYEMRACCVCEHFFFVYWFLFHLKKINLSIVSIKEMNPLDDMCDALVSINNILQKRKQIIGDTGLQSNAIEKPINKKEVTVDSSLSLNITNTKFQTSPVLSFKSTTIATQNKSNRLHFESLTEDNFYRAHLCNRSIDELPSIVLSQFNKQKSYAVVISKQNIFNESFVFQ